MESLANRQERAWAASSQVPPVEPSNGFDWSVDQADAKTTAGDVTCYSAGNTMLVLYFACETSSVEVDAGLRTRRMPGRACLGSGYRGSRDLHLKSGKVLQPCGRGHKIGTNCMLGSCAGPHRRTLQCYLGLLLI